MAPQFQANPFPGLRPFEPEEDHLFFGREKQIDELLRRLRSTRFLSVVGSSGSGKSSLVRCGLIPSLHSGFMVTAGSSWRIAMIRPGEDPIGNLATALNGSGVLGPDGELTDVNRMLLEATLRRSTLGLVNTVQQARIPASDNLLVIVDQFEELFRFRRSGQIDNSRDEAVAFVKLLLQGVHQDQVPVYVILTMRSDFIGDCMDYPGLPEAINAGQYLVPRMTRDELRSAITGPIAVGNGEISSRLVLRLLNDMADDQDRLPVLQHALMRTWDYWQRHKTDGEPIDIADYEAVGTLARALSLHAEEAYLEASSDRNRRIVERLFKGLTDTFSDPRGTRRPAPVQELAAICDVSEQDVIDVIEIFRKPGRSFLMPPPPTPINSRSMIDLSHESLMRCWTRLITWTEEERTAATTYVRISQAASWFEQGTAGLWRNPELEIGLKWKEREQPTAAWAARYHAAFERAMAFLDRSEQEQVRLDAEREHERKRKLRQVQYAAIVLGIMLGVALSLAYIAWREKAKAEANLQLAKTAVDESLSSAGMQQAREAADIPQNEEFRRGLLEKAKNFYVNYLGKQEPEKFRGDIALAHARLGDINRLLENDPDAVKEYQTAIAQFQRLTKQHPDRADYRQSLAYCYNWLGETLRVWLRRSQTSPFTRTDAEIQYNNALRVQEELVGQAVGNRSYEQELARTHYNRGILLYDEGDLSKSELDFRQAIGILEPLVGKSEEVGAAEKMNPQPSQELARAYNDLANLLRRRGHLTEANQLYERAIGIHEALSKEVRSNREYKMELAQFDDNLALLLLQEDRVDPAKRRNQEAVDLLEELAVPASVLVIQRANAHIIHSWILNSEGSPQSLEEARHTLEMLNGVTKYRKLQNNRQIQITYANLGTDFVEIASRNLKSGSLASARTALESLGQILPELSGADRTRLTRSCKALQKTLEK